MFMTCLLATLKILGHKRIYKDGKRNINTHKKTFTNESDVMSNINKLVKAILEFKFNPSEQQHQKILDLISSNSKHLNKAAHGEEYIDGVTALTAACAVGDVRLVKALLNAGADVNVTGKNKNTPLIVAAEEGREDIVVLLLKHHADFRIENKSTYAPILVAVYVQATNVVRILIETLLANIPTDDKKIASDSRMLSRSFYYAASQGYEEIVDVFLGSKLNINFYSHQVNINSTDGYSVAHNTALTIALFNSRNDIAKKIINAGFVVDAIAPGSIPPLFVVLRNSEMTALLLAKGADPKISFQGKPLFFRMIESNNLRMLELVYKANPIDLETLYMGETPLTYAVLNKCDTSVVFLLQKGVKVDATNTQGHTALSLAMKKCTFTIISMLIRHKANTQFICNETNDTSLMMAARRNMFDVVKVLVENLTLGQLTLKNNHNETALSIAASTSNIEMTFYLAKKINPSLFPLQSSHVKDGDSCAYFPNIVMNLLSTGFDLVALKDMLHYLYEPLHLTPDELYMSNAQIKLFIHLIMTSNNPVVKYVMDVIKFSDLYAALMRLDELLQLNVDEDNILSCSAKLYDFFAEQEAFMTQYVHNNALQKRVKALKQEKVMQVLGTLVCACVYNLSKVQSSFKLNKFIDSIDDGKAKSLYLALRNLSKIDEFLFKVVDQLTTYPDFEPCKIFILERISNSCANNNKFILLLASKAKLTEVVLSLPSLAPAIEVKEVDSIKIEQQVENLLEGLEQSNFIANVIKRHNGGISVEERAFSDRVDEKLLGKSGIRKMPHFLESNPIIEEIVLPREQRRYDISALIKANPSFVNRPNEYGLAPLYIAINCKSVESVSALVDAGADINFATEVGESILYKAVSTGRHDIVGIILKAKPDLNCLFNSITALTKAVESNFIDIVKMLVEAGADINAAGKDSFPPLYVAANKGYIEVVKYLLKNKADVEKGVTEQTPLFVAVVNGHQEVVDCLIAAKAQVNIGADGRLPTYIATMNKSPGILRSLVRAGGIVNISYNYKTLVRSAVQNNDAETLQVLLQAKADASTRYKHDGLTALQYAATLEYVDIVKVFCNPNAKLNKTTQLVQSPVDSSGLAVCMLPDYGVTPEINLSYETKLILRLIQAGMSVQNNHLTKWLSHPASNENNKISLDFLRDIIGLMANKKIDTLTDDDYCTILPCTKLLRMLLSCHSSKFLSKVDAISNKVVDASNGFDDMMSLFQGVLDMVWIKTYLTDMKQLKDKMLSRSLENPAYKSSMDVLNIISWQLVTEFCKSLKLTLSVLNQIPFDSFELKRLNTLDSHVLRLYEIKEVGKKLFEGFPDYEDHYHEQISKALDDAKASLNHALLMKTEAIADDAKKVKEELRRKKTKETEKKTKLIEAKRKEKEEADRIEAALKAKEEAARKEAARKEAILREAERRKEKEEAARRQVEQRKAKEEAARKEIERKVKEEAMRKEAEQKAMEEAALKEAERIAKEEADRLEIERKVKETERTARQARVKGYFDFVSVDDCYLVGGVVISLISKKSIIINDYDFVAKCSDDEISGLLQKNFVLNENLPDKSIKLYSCRSSFIDFTRVSFDQSDWLNEDIKKRDFTKCAVYCDKHGNLYDPTGRGIVDIQQGILAMIGGASDFYADPIRLLRALRYIALGDKPDAALQEAIKNWSINYLLQNGDREKKHFFIKYEEFSNKYENFIDTLKQYSLFDVINAEHEKFLMLEQQAIIASQQHVQLYQTTMYRHQQPYQPNYHPPMQPQYQHNGTWQQKQRGNGSQHRFYQPRNNNVMSYGAGESSATHNLDPTDQAYSK